jgi:predicted ATPase
VAGEVTPSFGNHQGHNMLTQLHLKKFKAWDDTQPIAIKPVTMLLGTNSSGKSTLIQSLLLLRQTVQSPDRTIHLNLGGDEVHDFFNFGDFDSILKQGASPRHFELMFEFDRPDTTERVAHGGFRCSYGQISTGAVEVQTMRLWEKDGTRVEAIRREKGAYSLVMNEETQPRGKSRDFTPERSIALSTKALVALESDGEKVQDISLAVRRELESIVYLGPLRRKPERDYVWNRSKPGEVGIDGHKAVDVLLASTLLKGDGKNEVAEGVSKWLQKMNVADKLEVRQIGRSTRYEVVVHRNGVIANLRDVGIGVSQVLPVLTVAFFAPKGSTILLEEPEIHLHPLAQSVLAELFVEVSRTRGVQFIVETHSEHLFRRMQTLVAKEETTVQDCAMYFVEKDNANKKSGNAKIRELKLDDYGRLTNWPDKFFGDALGETRDQARLMFERQKKAST